MPHWNVGNNSVQWAEIEFKDLAPPYLFLQQCWNGMGMDDKGHQLCAAASGWCIRYRRLA
jgi:hypothetical protein